MKVQVVWESLLDRAVSFCCFVKFSSSWLTLKAASGLAFEAHRLITALWGCGGHCGAHQGAGLSGVGAASPPLSLATRDVIRSIVPTHFTHNIQLPPLISSSLQPKSNIPKSFSPSTLPLSREARGFSATSRGHSALPPPHPNLLCASGILLL